MKDPALWLRTICISNGLAVSDKQLDLLSKYVHLLLEWNTKINLISRRDVDNVWTSHILHSISPLFELRLIPQPSVLDLGCGGGLPGVPLKILNPDMQMTLLDATRKKITAVQDILEKLGLEGVDTVSGRAEDMARIDSYRGRYHYVVVRAVASLADLAKWSRSFLRGTTELLPEKPKVGFVAMPPALIALKGGDVQKEVNEARNIAGLQSVSVVTMKFKGSERLLENDKKIIVIQF